MESFTYCVPTEIVFGQGAEDNTAAEVAKFGGRRVLIVAGGRSARRSGLLDRLEKQLDDAGLAHAAFEGAQPNPRLAHAREGVRAALAFGADFILAVGGGSAIDTGKAVAHGAANPDVDLWEFWTRRRTVEKSLPVGAVLTIPAAGSETSDSAVLTDEQSGQKRGLSTPHNRPVFAVMDPALALSLPDFQVSCGVVDIMMHTLDRYFNPVATNELTDALAEALLRTVIANGRKALADRADCHAMSEIMWCGSVSHNGLTGLGGEKDFAPHQLGHELSARFDVAHGASLSAVWGAWAAEALAAVGPARFAQYGRAVWGLAGEDAAVAREAIEATVVYFVALGMPTGFVSLGIGAQSEQELAALAEGATYGRTRTIGSFYRLGYDQVLAVYRRANR